MRSFTALLVAASMLWLTTAGAEPAAAQLAPIDASGTVAAIAPQAISIRTDTGNVLIGLIDPNRVDENVVYTGIPEPQLQVNGVESTDFLKPGMFVRFEAELDDQRAVKREVSQVTLITPTKDTVFGVLPNAIGGAAERPAAGNNGEAALETFLIAGRLTYASRGSITVALPENKTVKARLAPDAVVNIAASDIRLVRVGDKIQAQGFATRPPKFFATTVTVTRADEDDARRQPRRPSNPGAAAREERPAANAPDPFKIGGPSDRKPDEPARPKQPGRILKVN